MIKNISFKFFLYTFILSGVFWALGFAVNVEIMPGLPLSSLNVYVPGAVALFLLYRDKGTDAVKKAVVRVLDIKRIRHKSLLLPIILLKPVIYLTAYLVMWFSGRVFQVYVFRGAGLMLLFVVFFIAAAGEELGWTALAQEKLQQQYGPLKAALIIGVLWSAWHVLPWLQVGRSLA